MEMKSLKQGLNPLAVCLIMTFAIFLLMDVASASYKKPPFNGSIFGKRANGITDYETPGRTLSSLCELASEACSAWFPQSENK